MNRRKRRSPIFYIVDSVCIIATIVSAAALFLSCLAPYVNPNGVWIFSFFGLIAPILYIINAAFLLFWILSWRVYFAIPLVVLLFGFGHISKFFKPNFGKVYGEEKNVRADLTVMSYNVRGFIKKVDHRFQSTAPEITDYILEADPDIICLQEYQTTPKYGQNYFDSILRKWPYRAIYYSISKDDIGIGVAVFSKHKILNSEKIEFADSGYNSSMIADILLDRRDTIRIFNNHLQTTQIDEDNLAFFYPENFANEKRKKEIIKDIGRKLRNNYMVRASQADTMAMIIHGQNRSSIVCGDLNDTPISYAYRKVRGEYHDAFQDAGHGFHSTYKAMSGLLCIDFIFYSDGFESVYFTSPTVDASDHNPVMAKMRRIKDK